MVYGHPVSVYVRKNIIQKGGCPHTFHNSGVGHEKQEYQPKRQVIACTAYSAQNPIRNNIKEKAYGHPV